MNDSSESGNLFSHIAAVAQKNQSAACIKLVGTQDWTYADLLSNTWQFAGFIHDAGLRKGDRVLAQSNKCPEALALYLACLQLGVVYVPVNNTATLQEIKYFVDNSEPKLIFLCEESENRDEFAIPCFVLGESTGSLIEHVRQSTPRNTVEPVHEDDLAAILYTSGTTGRSKGAMLTHRNLHSNAKTLLSAWHWQSTDVLLHALPIYHVHGLFVASHCVLLSGTSMWFLPTFDIEQLIELIPESTVLMGVPTYYSRLLKSDALTPGLVKNMRLFISGSAPLTEQTFNAFSERTGHQILERYGMSETIMNSSNPYDGERVAGTVGFELYGINIRIVDENSNEAAPGDVGEIQIKGPNVFRGYWRMPEKTQEEFTADGYFKSGDLAFKDSDGRISIVGREKDLVISGGMNVYPAEVETLIDEIAGVEENAVIGVPHPDFGEGVVAVVVATKPIELPEVRSWLKKKIAAYKHPKSVIQIEELPKNAMGKIQKNVLREMYGSLFNT